MIERDLFHRQWSTFDKQISSRHHPLTHIRFYPVIQQVFWFNLLVNALAQSNFKRIAKTIERDRCHV